jgi:hypothetical protein
MLQFLAVLTCTTLGFSDTSPTWTITAMAGVPTLLGASEDRAVAVRFSKLGSTRVLSLAMAQSALSNLVFAAISFAIGRGIAWLMGGLQ